MDDTIILFAHPDGMGAIEHAPGILIVTNDLDATSAVVRIGTNGLRDLAARLLALADEIDGGQQ